MSHSKVHSQGNIPFSWEDKPGVSKSSEVTHCDNQYHRPIGVGSYPVNETNPPSDTGGGSSKILVYDKKVPPPPPFSMQLLQNRSTSVKGLRWWWKDDPFLAAYKECTKSRGNGKLSSEASTNGDSEIARKKKKKKKITFSCKKSSEVRDDNLVWFSNLPPLPKGRIRGRQEFVQALEGVLVKY